MKRLYAPASGGSSGDIPKRYGALGQGGKNAEGSTSNKGRSGEFNGSQWVGLRLLRENEQLQMERGIIKKAAAFPSASLRLGFAKEVE